MGVKELGLFISLSMVLIVTPGPDLIYVLTRGISLGEKAGFISAAGITAGILIHTILAALGLSIILQTSAIAFLVIKVTGAIYLIFLGIQSIIKRKKINWQSQNKTKTHQIFIQGVLSNVLNPKVALLFMAFLPQFVDVSKGETVTLQFIILGLIFAFMCIIFLSILAVFSGRIGQYFAKNQELTSRLQVISGLIILGVRLAFIYHK